MEVEDQAQMHTAAECEMESESEAEQSSGEPLSPPSSTAADQNSRVQVGEPEVSAQNVAFSPTFKIVGDNIDKKVKPRYMREDRQAQMLNNFHLYAVRDRVDTSNLSEELPSLRAFEELTIHDILPSCDDRDKMLKNYVTLFARIITAEIPFFKQFQDAVPVHIGHEHSREMERKSEVVSSTFFTLQSNSLVVLYCAHSCLNIVFNLQVPLGVLFKLEQKHEDMLSIMESTQHQYAPFTTVQKVVHAVTEEGEEDVTVDEVQFHPLLFGGDQLTAERSRSCKTSHDNSDTPHERLDGLEPVVEDWHVKQSLYGVSNNMDIYCTHSHLHSIPVYVVDMLTYRLSRIGTPLHSTDVVFISGVLENVV